jgi:hypothetical protein
MKKLVEYNIERYNDNKAWIHCCYGGKTKADALKRLKKVAAYKWNQGYDFKIVRDEYKSDYIGRF